jgi:hypothetical protein
VILSAIARVLFGPLRYVCECGEPFASEREYSDHWAIYHGLDRLTEGVGPQAEVKPGVWAPAIPLPLVVRTRRASAR